MTTSLNCPTCGAPASGADAARCDYCGSTLSTMGCPSCFGAMFVGMEFCPHCGAKAARIDGSATLPCPCSGTMRALQVGQTTMFECGECASTWLDTATFTQLCANREAHGAIAAMTGPSTAAVKTTVTGGVRYRPCPACKKIMNRDNFGHRSGVIIDVCKGHGVWFERGELHSVLEFIDGGGLEHARQKDEEQHGEERRAAASVARMTTTPAPADWDASRTADRDGSIGSMLEDALRRLLT